MCFRWPDDLIAGACSRLTRNLTYEEWQRYLPDEPYRKTCENIPVHPSFIEVGRDLARAGDLDGAVTQFQEALKLESSLDLEPEAEARRFAALALLTEGEKLVERGKVKEAIAAYEQAQTLLDPTLQISADSWNILGWYGSLWGYAVDVMYTCERAVELEPENGFYYDSRGLARALTGDYEGAIEDFQFYVEWGQNKQPEELLRKRQDWVRQLKAGRNPFDAATLEALRNE